MWFRNLRLKMAASSSSSSSSSSSLRAALLLLGLLMCLAVGVQSMCPRACRCSKDSRGRKQVICDQGGMEDSIPVSQMEYDIWRLVVTAPSYHLNSLAISRIFYRFTHLKEIHITNSLIPAIGDGSFKGLVLLEILNLTDNNITQLLDTNFQDLRDLRSLHLDRNNIRHMPSAAFHNLPNLKRLTMSNNKIIQLVPRLFLKLSNLEVLDLKSNPLQLNVDADVFKDVRQLKVLNLSDCQQTLFNSLLLRHLPLLEILDLSYNKLPYFSIDDAHYAPRLKELYLHGNRISSIFDNTFGGLDLKVLTLAFNQLQFLNSESFKNVTIRELDISYNQVQITDPSLLNLIALRLQVLYIGGNIMSQYTLGKMLQNLPDLQTLGIGGLNLREIDPSLLRLPSSLRNLNLSNNGLSRVPIQTLGRVQHLQSLDLSRNEFRGIDRDLLDQFDSMRLLKTLYLHDNPFACDRCYIPALMAWLNQSRQFQKACQPNAPNVKSCLRCVSPPELTGKAFQLLDDALLGGCEGDGPLRSVAFHRSHVGLAVACIILLLLLVTVGVVVILYYRRGAEYYTHEEDRDDDAVYENPGVDDETGDLLNDKKIKVLLPPSLVSNANANAHHNMPDGNGHADHRRQFGNNHNQYMNANRDNGRMAAISGEHC